MAPETTDDAEDENGTSDDDQSSEGIQEVLEALNAQLTRVEDRGEQIKKVVARAYVGGGDHDIATDLAKELADHLRDRHSTHEAVTIDEIILALWLELYRTSEMATSDPAEAEDNGADADADRPENDTPGTGQSVLADGGEDDGDDQPAAPADPAFQ